MAELKPCPFCGSTNISMWVTDRGEPFGALYYFECQNCGVKTEPDDDEIDATFAWNRRVKDAEIH